MQNATYEQKDPLVIYKVEAFHLFQDMLSRLNTKMASTLMRGHIPMREAPAPQDVPEQQPGEPKPKAQAPEMKQAGAEMPRRYQYRESKASLPGEEAQRAAASAPQGERPKPMPVHAQPKVGRNDPCPCGSGKKYKNCHGRGL